MTRIAALLFLTTLAITGCTTDRESAPTAGPDQVEVLARGTTQVNLARGATVQVSLGDYQPGVGDDWGVVNASPEGLVDADVIRGDAVAGQDAESPSAPPKVGGKTAFAVRITGVESGRASVTVVYCTRAAVEDGCDQTHGTLDAPIEPVVLDVTVD